MRQMLAACLLIVMCGCSTPSSLPEPSEAAQRLRACPIIDPALLAPAPRAQTPKAGADARVELGVALSANDALANRYDELAGQASRAAH